MDPVQIGIIGGSGVYQLEKLRDVTELDLTTPFGKPSDTIRVGTLAGKRVAFLARHGRGHRIMPTELNSRANIFAFKTLGVEWLISISACGSLRPDFAPRHIVVPNQLVDFTRNRTYSFFGNGLVAHVSLADPFCPILSEKLIQAVRKTGATVHQSATYITIEGPRFSTRAESNLFRQWGIDIIGMTAIPEAVLAREAEMCYAMMAHVTDYDCWHATEAVVSVELLIENLMANAEISKQAIENLIPDLEAHRPCSCSQALATSIITQHDLVNPETKSKLKPLIEKYIK